MMGCEGLVGSDGDPTGGPSSMSDGGRSTDPLGGDGGEAVGEDGSVLGDGGAARPPDPPLEPMYPDDGFCGEGDSSWAFCEDFDGRGASGPAPLDLTGTGIHYVLHGHGQIEGVSCEVSGDCASYFQGGTMLTIPEESGFGWSAIRPEQPFDFAGREGHIRFTTNFNTHGRLNVGIILSPVATNSMPDNRQFEEEGTGILLGAMNRAPALAVKSFRTSDHGGRAVGDVQVWRDGLQQQYRGVAGETVIGFDRTLTHEYDVFVTRTHIRALMDGNVFLDTDLEDIGFDRAYVYLAGLSYNAMKEEGIPHTREANTILWDNIAFDGPVLARNSLTPDGMVDVVFRANAVSDCTVRGVAAEGPPTEFYLNFWAGWTARLPADVGPITADDITCTLRDWPRDHSVPQWGNVTIVRRFTSTDGSVVGVCENAGGTPECTVDLDCIDPVRPVCVAGFCSAGDGGGAPLTQRFGGSGCTVGSSPANQHSPSWIVAIGVLLMLLRIRRCG
jgi:hypothetical protein